MAPISNPPEVVSAVPNGAALQEGCTSAELAPSSALELDRKRTLEHIQVGQNRWVIH
jgi:hypothetical protein